MGRHCGSSFFSSKYFGVLFDGGFEEEETTSACGICVIHGPPLEGYTTRDVVVSVGHVHAGETDVDERQ